MKKRKKPSPAHAQGDPPPGVVRSVRLARYLTIVQSVELPVLDKTGSDGPEALARYAAEEIERRRKDPKGEDVWAEFGELGAFDTASIPEIAEIDGEPLLGQGQPVYATTSPHSLIRCGVCGSLNIEQEEWLDLNTSRVTGGNESIPDLPTYCSDCEEMTEAVYPESNRSAPDRFYPERCGTGDMFDAFTYKAPAKDPAEGGAA